ncbi:Protein of unknown function [Mesorhizobium albiziae]|uniref:DUF3300 domain-containing protein n=1 Tax=Neomesorhizobium albiziae TaxID=335020 RepID=A0A1I3VN59_9HYPH|nr:DUF3300 domain-containing protein [Mesorhizobium albiziae]GLS29061.1 hypothetical protein GCM10007937_07680 [Mesorhizobium albiziae]SFJ96818.1 Protein of unknown function [Mesorhizobium albiziae]
MKFSPLFGFRSAGFVVLALLASANLPVYAQTAAPTDAAAPADATDEAAAPLSLDDLKVLAARIALYPDDLVALCVSASLYPLQIVQAARFLDDKKKTPDLEPSDKWDGSVISLLNYPEVVKMMNDDLDWTEQLGDVAANQQKDLLVAIQQLRDEAMAKGVLKSSQQVQVVNEGDNVVIKSSDPKTIYVPTYPPEMLYDPGYVVTGDPIVYAPYPSYYYPTAPYWAGFVTGAAFAAVVDWDRWGTWGGHVDWDVDVGNRVDFDFNKIDINNIDVNKLNKLDFRNIDRSKIDLKNTNFDRTKLKQNLESKDFNNIARKAKDRPGNGVQAGKLQARAHDLKGKDVRKNVAEGLKNRPNAKLPAPGTRQVDAKQIGNQLKTARPAINKPAAQRVAQKHVDRPRPAARVDNRPRRPSALGHPQAGRVTHNFSNRGFQSRGGGHLGGGPRGGGGRIHRR